MTPASIPFLDLVSPHLELEGELTSMFLEVLRSSEFVGGTHVEQFEREFAAYCGAAHCVGVSSGTDALRLALMAVGVRRDDAVITVANTFAATTEAISQAGAHIEFVDIDPRTCLMSVSALERYLSACATDDAGYRVGRRTGRPITAVVPVHLHGQMVDMHALDAVAARYRLHVVEDACQAHGAACLTRGGADVWRRAGSFGRAAAFSFYPGKNLGACGEAGAVTTNDSDVAQSVAMLRNHGQSRKHLHQLEGYNARLDALQAALLRVKLSRLDTWNDGRRAAATRYNELLADLAQPADGLTDGVTLPSECGSSRSVYHVYAIRSPHRDALAEHLRAEGIQTAIHYPVPLHLQPCYSALGYAAGSLPVTERAMSQTLSLPMFPHLQEVQQRRVTDTIRTFVRKS